MFKVIFWQQTAQRVMRTFIQVAAAELAAVYGGLWGVDFGRVISVAGLAALIALLMALYNPSAVVAPPQSGRHGE